MSGESRTTALIAHDESILQSNNCEKPEINFLSATGSKSKDISMDHSGERNRLDFTCYGQHQNGFMQFDYAELAFGVFDMGGHSPGRDF